jgi:hypothetical protein
VGVALPPPSEISAIEVNSNNDDRAATVIDDRARIAEFVAFLNERGDNWEHPPYTFPSGQYTVAVKSRGELIAVFWPAPGHIGGRQGDQGAESNRLRPLSDKEWVTLQGILKIPTQ